RSRNWSSVTNLPGRRPCCAMNHLSNSLLDMYNLHLHQLRQSAHYALAVSQPHELVLQFGLAPVNVIVTARASPRSANVWWLHPASGEAQQPVVGKRGRFATSVASGQAHHARL